MSAPTSRGMGAGMVDKGKPEEVASLEGRLTGVRFYTVAEVAGVMRVSKMSVYRLIHSGELEAVRFGRSFRVPESAVKAFLDTSYFETG
jgi:excisionase family DNA binding protein